MFPEEISAMVLQKMKETAEDFLGEDVTRAVVTVPAYFNEAQRLATKDAGRIAGLKVERIINEPTAAAIAYGLPNKSDEEQTVVVYDLGGGTFDVTILNIDDGVFDVLSSSGDTHLGGQDFDQNVMQYFIKSIKKKYQVNLNRNKRAMARLRREVEKAKRALSSVRQVKVEVESLIEGEDFSETLTRARFEKINQHLFERTLEFLSSALKHAGIKKNDVTDIVLVGGSTRIPKVQSMVKNFFNGKEPNCGINPDEAVAYGAAVQGGILLSKGSDLKGFSKLKELIVLDVTPLPLGVETTGGVMTNLIKANERVPHKTSKNFTTHVDNQREVLIKVYQGHRSMAKDNVLLGEFMLTGIPPAPRGIPQIEVTFQMNADGVLNAMAKELGSGNQKGIIITADKGRLSKEEIQRMIREAEEFAEEDKRLKEIVDARNTLESYAYSMRNVITDEDELGDKIYEEDKAYIDEVLQATLDWLDENPDAERQEYEEKMMDLKSVLHPIFQALYEIYGGGDDGEGDGDHDDDFSNMEDHDEL